MSKFNSTHNKGFRMTFENGFSISVQWGPGNYCERKDADSHAPMKDNYWESISAEIAVFNKEGNKVILANKSDEVAGWLSTDTVAKCITIIQSAHPDNEEEITEKLKTLGL